MNQTQSRLLVLSALDQLTEYMNREIIKDNNFINEPKGLIELLNKYVFSRIGLRLFNKDWIDRNFYDYYYLNSEKLITASTLKLLLTQSEKFDEIHNLLEDDESRKTFEWLIKYRVTHSLVGNKAMEIVPSPYIRTIIKNSYKKSPIKYKNGCANIRGYSISGDEGIIYDSWVKEQYLYKGKCEPNKGDTVISGGALFGETSLWFADKVGESGKVYAFEPSHLSYLKANENVRNNGMSHIVEIINAGLWHSDSSIRFNESLNNPASSYCDEEHGSVEIKSLSLDSFVERKNISKVNYLKLDTEGAEINILNGARELITVHKPKIAIIVYHRADNILEIPLLLRSFVPEYKFYLSHKNLAGHETVLFASLE